mmetsp:Transcript_7313/g.11490  ORF Transcript_7313/g.11490 Transcript_7313/m.11490 type:complete len:127 (+) Transcript_7313:632-1012(+)
MKTGRDFSMVVASAFQYKAPATFLDALTIHATVTRWGRTSFEVEYRGEVSNGSGAPVASPPNVSSSPDASGACSGAKAIFTGTMTYVCIDENKRPKVIRPEFREQMPRGVVGVGVGGGGSSPRSKL